MKLFSFNRINSVRSIPTCMWGISTEIHQPLFQSYQFSQINPDTVGEDKIKSNHTRWFQSYQFSQINPDWILTAFVEPLKYQGFNRINSVRSIPTSQINSLRLRLVFWVSIVSIQSDQSRRAYATPCNITVEHSFNRINSVRSIPTEAVAISIVQDFYGFNRINSVRSIPTNCQGYSA